MQLTYPGPPFPLGQGAAELGWNHWICRILEFVMSLPSPYTTYYLNPCTRRATAANGSIHLLTETQTRGTPLYPYVYRLTV